MATERIYLIGFMGAGKTTVGRLVAERLGWTFVDLDDAIERAEGRSVADIFRTAGETDFRGVESRQLREVSRNSRCVVALGGGTYVDAQNRACVEENGLSVYLEASLQTIQGRIDDDGSRPLFAGDVGTQDLYHQREPLYRMAAVTINTDNLCAREIADRVIHAINLE